VSALVAVLVVRLLDETAAFLPSGTLESFRADLGLTYAQAGTVLAMVAPGALVGGAFSAAADRFSRRAIAAAGAFGFAASLAAFAVGGSFGVLAGAALVMGAASTAMVDAAEVALVDLAGEDLRRCLARSNLLGAVGDLLGPAVVAAVSLSGLSWRAAFAVGAAMLGLYGLALAASPLPPPLTVAPGDEPIGPRSPLLAVLGDPSVWILGAIGLLLAPFDEPLAGFMIALLEKDRGASAGVATAVALVGLSGGLVAYTLLAHRLERFGDGRILFASTGAMTLGAVLIAVVPVVPVVAISAFVTSIGLNLGWLALQHRSLTLRPGQVGTTMAVLGTIEFGGFLVPMGIGALADRFGLVTAVASYGTLGAALVAMSWWARRRE
jgi:predicted MFS family arabinose efflux permease